MIENALSMPGDERARLACQRWSELKAERSLHEADWAAQAALIRPQRGGFGLDDFTTRQFDMPLSSAPVMAQSNFAAGLYGTLSNPSNVWFALKTDDDDANNWAPNKLWLDTVSRLTLASFSPATSPFYSATMQAYSDLATFGNAPQYDELVQEERKILDVTLSLAEAVADIDGFGRVCEIVRRFRLTPAQAMSRFKGRGLPARISEMLMSEPRSKIVFYQHVLKNDDWRPGALGPRGKRWVSRYVCEIDETLISEGGYEEMPFYFPRWEVESGFIYGFGPGSVALPAARAYAQMEAATLRAAQRAADPTLIATDKTDFPLSGRIKPGSVVYGGILTNGATALRELQITSQVNLTLEEKQAKLEEIKDAFNYTLMSLAGRTGMTATEVQTINEERMRLWAPHMGRIQEEYLAPKIARRFGLLWRAGQLPPPPPSLAGKALQVDYQSAAAMAQKAAEATAITRILADITPLAQVKPRLLDRLDDDGLFEALIEARGAPARIARSREEADKLEQARNQQQQITTAMQMAQAGSQTAKNLQALQQGQGGGAPQ